MLLNKRSAMSLIELIITVMVISLAVIPMLLSITSTNIQVYSMGKHQLAALAARSLLDRLMLLPYEECHQKCLEMGTDMAVLADPEFAALAGRIDFKSRDFEDMTSRVAIYDAANAEEQERLFVIEVTVSWPVPKSYERRHISFKTIKYQTRI